MNEIDGKKLSIYVEDGFAAFFFTATAIMMFGGLCGYFETPGPKTVPIVLGSLMLAVANSGVLFKTLQRLTKKPSSGPRVHLDWLETQRQEEAKSWAILLPLLTIGAIGLASLVSNQVLLTLLAFCLLRSLSQFLYQVRLSLSSKVQGVLKGFRNVLNFSSWVFFILWGIYSLVIFQNLSKNSIIDFTILLFYWAVLVQKNRSRRSDLDVSLVFSEGTDSFNFKSVDTGVITLGFDRGRMLQKSMKHKQKS